MEMPFGKYAGCDLGGIPSSYLCWLCRALKPHSELRAAAARELANRREPVPDPVPREAAGPARCHRCGPSWEPRYTWRVDKLRRRHVRLSCGRCGTHLAFVPQTRQNVEAANAAESERPPPPRAAAPATPRPFVGYGRRDKRSPWQVLVPSADTYAEAWDKLLAAAEPWQRELLVTRGDPGGPKARSVPVRTRQKG